MQTLGAAAFREGADFLYLFFFLSGSWSRIDTGAYTILPLGRKIDGEWRKKG